MTYDSAEICSSRIAEGVAETTRCRFCDNGAENKEYRVREMMFGSKEEFSYFQCSKCQSIQASEIIEDLTKYYPSTYHDFLSGGPDGRTEWPAPDWSATMAGGPILNHFEVMRNPELDWDSLLTERAISFYLSRVGINREANVLDVGTANGSFLRSLRKAGFSGRLLGVEPYQEEDLEFEDGVRVVKGSIHDIDPRPEWDLITLHHSFEHVPDPLAVLQSVSRLLSPDGVCLIRTPVVPCDAFEQYGVHWISLDAPRHYFIPSPESMRALAEKAGLRLVDIVYDSTPLQFWGSEQYQREVSFYSERSFAVNPLDSMFPLIQIRVFEKRAEELNRSERGDQAAFYLVPQP